MTNYKRLSKDLISEKDKEIYQSQNIKKLLNINNKEDISYKRKQLIKYIYGTSSISKLSDVYVKEKIKDEKYLDLKNLKFIDEITIKMDYGINSIAYKFVPYKKNNKLLIYHQGHLGDFYIGKNTISYFLSKGYEVIAFAMPTIGFNSKPTIFINNIGTLKIDSHDKLKFLEHKDN